MGIDAEEIYRNVLIYNRLENGSIILMHNNGEHTAEALGLIIPALREKGYEFVKVSDLINAVPIYRFKLKKMQRNR